MKKTDQQVKVSIQDEDYYDQVRLETDPDRYDIDTESVAGFGEEIVNAHEAKRRRSCRRRGDGLEAHARCPSAGRHSTLT